MGCGFASLAPGRGNASNHSRVNNARCAVGAPAGVVLGLDARGWLRGIVTLSRESGTGFQASLLFSLNVAPAQGGHGACLAVAGVQMVDIKSLCSRYQTMKYKTFS